MDSVTAFFFKKTGMKIKGRKSKKRKQKKRKEGRNRKVGGFLKSGIFRRKVLEELHYPLHLAQIRRLFAGGDLNPLKFKKTKLWIHKIYVLMIHLAFSTKKKKETEGKKKKKKKKRKKTKRKKISAWQKSFSKQPICIEAKKMKAKKTKKKPRKNSQKKKKNEKERSTALGIRMWSPTILLTQPTDA